jgi:hypothetical protein
MYKVIVVCIVVAVTAVGVVVASSGAQAPGSRVITVHETEKGSHFKFADIPPIAHPKRNQPPTVTLGDRFVFSNPFTEGGSLYGVCTGVKKGKFGGGAMFLCDAVARLKDGDIFITATYTPSGGDDDSVDGALTGGTGAYSGARGSFAGRPGGTDTFTILP